MGFSYLRLLELIASFTTLGIHCSFQIYFTSFLSTQLVPAHLPFRLISLHFSSFAHFSCLLPENISEECTL